MERISHDGRDAARDRRQLNREIVAIVRTREFAERIAGRVRIPVGNTPEFDAIIRADIAKWAQVIRDAKIRADE